MKMILAAVALAFASVASAQEASVFADNGNQVAMNCKAPSPQLTTAAASRCAAIRQALTKIGFIQKQGAAPIDWKKIETAQDKAACDVLFMPATEGGIVNPVYCKSGNAQLSAALKSKLDAVIQR